MGCAASTEGRPPPGGEFELGRAWRLAPQVSIRPERFGGLAYHYGTRRLTFLKSRLLLEVVQVLDVHSSALEACRAVGVTTQELPRFAAALEALAQTGMIAPMGEG